MSNVYISYLVSFLSKVSLVLWHRVCQIFYLFSFRRSSAAPTSRNQHHPALGSICQGHPMRPFTWSGITVTRIHLATDRGQSVHLKACFVTPGVYDLGTAQVLAFPAAADGSGVPLQPMMQRPLAPSFITIHSRALPANGGGARVPS